MVTSLSHMEAKSKIASIVCVDEDLALRNGVISSINEIYERNEKLIKALEIADFQEFYEKCA